MQGHDFIFFLQDSQYRFWQVSETGVVSLSANPYPLDFSPDGWQDTGIQNQLNKKYWSIDRTVTIPLKYVNDGATILKHIFYTLGVQERVYLAICEQRLAYTAGVEYGYWHKLMYRGEIDLSTFQHAGAFVTCTATEQGFAEHLKSNENTVYEIPLTTGINVKMDGIVLNMKQNYSSMNEDFTFEDTAFTGEIAFPWFKTTAEGQAPYVFFDDEKLEDFDIDNSTFKYAVWTTNYPIMAVGGSPTQIDVNLTGKIKLQITVQRTVRQFKFYMWKITGSSPTTGYVRTELFSTGLMTAGVPYEYTLNQTVTLNAGERILFSLDRNPGASASTLSDYQIMTGTEMTASFKSRFSPTYIKAIRPQDLFRELIDRVTESNYSAATCPYFDVLREGDKVFTSGDGIRGFDDAVIKISLAQFFGFWNTYDEVGLKEIANRKILLDRKVAQLDTVNTINLGEAGGLTVSFDKELAFNELAIGYPDVKNENGFVNGRNEFNTTFNWSTGTSKTVRKYEKISQVKASGYDIESIRIVSVNKDTTDNRADNDSFVLHIADTLIPGSGDIPDHYELDRSLNPFILGVDEKETVFNVALSPKRCLLRSGDFLRSCFFRTDATILKFISADRNSDMEYINGADVIIEKDNVVVGNLASRFFDIPILQAIVRPPEDFIDQLDQIPGRCVSFTFNENTYTGITIKNSVTPSSRKEQTFEIWPLASTDLKPLIEFYGE